MNDMRFATERNGRTVGEGIAELKEEIKDFVQTRIQMFTNEMREKIRDSKSAAVYGAIGAILLGTAYLLLNLALVGLVAVAFWGTPYAWFLAFLIVGLCWSILGGLMALLAARKFQGLAPKKTIEVLKGRQDLAAARSEDSGMSTTPQHNEPTYTLELRAADQRRRLHSSVVELRSRLHERLDPKQLGRDYLVPASGVAALLGLVLGYGLTGVFTRR